MNASVCPLVFAAEAACPSAAGGTADRGGSAGRDGASLLARLLGQQPRKLVLVVS